MKFLSKQFKQDIIKKKGNLSLRQLEKKLNISASTLSRLENGSIPELITYAVICKWLMVSMNKYFKPTAEENLREILKDIAYEQATRELSGATWCDKIISRINNI